MKRLVFATSNAHKLSEIRGILPHFDIAGLQDIGISEDIEETGTTLEENALIKAKFLYEKTRMPSLSEDTGLEVFSLNGAPGVHTARYAGDEKDPEKNMEKLLAELEYKSNRQARFRTVISYVAQDETHFFEGIVNGSIALKKSGSKGFGYDPVFIPEGFDQSFADLDVFIKNKISHRARAVSKLIDFLSQSQ
ncbi:MAG: RdgB/HAM1 family non-canonical purine NTP pyrophosphatase [Saprospiraceae bacterium]|jgi:XTP/dITP diphosphohydrolase|nr:RdgB/HAM1 family non-canonical purine NTP pyrophosphatase [Saprospiraceae bacterium]